jgi:hypothetical protein
MIVRQKSITKGVCEVFTNRHFDKGLMNHLFLTHNFLTTKCQMSSNETMEQHVNKLSAMVEEFDAIGAIMPP